MKINFKNLFTIFLLCFSVVFAETDYKGECKDLQKKIEKNNTNDITFSLIDCTLDTKGKAVD